MKEASVSVAAPVAVNTPSAPAAARHVWPSAVEAILALAAIAMIAPLFAGLSDEAFVRDRRYASTSIALDGFPRPVLQALCGSHGPLAEPAVADRLCGSQARGPGATLENAMPAVLRDARSRIVSGFRSAIASAEARLAEHQLQGAAEPPKAGSAAHSLDVEIASFARRYGLERTGTSGPRSIECAFDQVSAAAGARYGDERYRSSVANALLLLGAAMDGHRAATALASSASLPASRPARSTTCASLSLTDALTQTTATMIDARAAALDDAKKAAMRELLPTAGWQWGAWMLAGLVLVKLSRSRLPVAAGIAIALVTWAAAAWAGRVPWPLGTDRTLELGRSASSPDAMPATFVVVLLGIAGMLFALSPLLRRRAAPVAQTLASRVGYAGFVVATGIGWLLLLDLSANGPPSNRYLALYHQGHLWLAMLVLTVLAFLRPVLGRGLAWLLSVFDELGGRLARQLGPLLAPIAMLAAVAVLVGGVAALLSGVRQLTSELGRLWLILGVAWFFFLRGAPSAERVARTGRPLGSLLRYVWPLAFVGLVLVALMLVTRDMGPLLIASYAAGAFLAACIAMWWHARSGATAAPAALGACLFAAWIVAITLAVFEFGAVHAVTADRLENLAAPLASANDQLALVTWFREAAPPSGFGIGFVPWCGFAASTACAGVPAQIQSDYTFTALVGAFGEAAAWMFTMVCAFWLHRLVRYHGRVTPGEPRFVRRGGRVVADEQAFVSWIGVTWVVLTLCQLAVTVAGNLAVVPLTGVTFPLVSFGMTSLVVNCAMVALCINVSRLQEGEVA